MERAEEQSIGPKRVLSSFVALVRGFGRFWAARPLLLTAVVALSAAGAIFGGMSALSYMETESFCGRCHTMTPQVEAHLFSPHESVECAECHVGNGLKGLIRSKWDGAHQAIKLITGTYARPIPPAAHKMPPANEICLRCHDPAKQTGDLLINRSQFGEDEGNSEQRVALVVRLSEEEEQGTEGIHWHVLSKVEYIATGEHGENITWIGVERPDGTREEFIAGSEVEMSGQADVRARELKAANGSRTMSCYDCHNRVGHEFTPPARAIDKALAEGSIDRALPYIKKWGLEKVGARYASRAEAFKAINELRESYHREYPWVFLDRPDKLSASLATLMEIYERSAAPEMGEASSDYPSYLGHTDSAGCFRCHDGGHYKIVDGALSQEPIPSQCSLCHTFPSVGAKVPSAMIGVPLASHEDPLWVFNHKTDAGSLDVNSTSCNSCHSQTYCSNCHNSGATNVEHDDMYYDHARVINEAGQQPCAYCHQRPFCVRCHESDKDKVFPRDDLHANASP